MIQKLPNESWYKYFSDRDIEFDIKLTTKGSITDEEKEIIKNNKILIMVEFLEESVFGSTGNVPSEKDKIILRNRKNAFAAVVALQRILANKAIEYHAAGNEAAYDVITATMRDISISDFNPKAEALQEWLDNPPKV